ncbi:non-ribosomal peptide synthetase [Acrocarpospora corrugata]|uniref:non-ribosomal peptide synthetase n=1 Tax=Acrocarpospora corrugata TaxID=35763 RepID=UPI00147927E1|nr:non-ribosomal peptide synthetase [Acrocarpospora corrugata]
MSLAQERLWFLHRLDPRDPSYHLFHVARLTGPLDPDRLAAALTVITDRHEVLRSRFPLRDGSPVQVVDSPEPFALELVDLAEPDWLVTDRISRPFDLAADRLIRATLIATGPERFTFCLVVHHIVADAWSLGLLRHELAVLYAGEEPPPLPAQYADFVRDADTGAPKSLDYWTEVLVGATPLDLPADRPRPAVVTTAGGHVQRDLPESLLRAVDKFAAVERCTPFMVLMAAYQALLSGRSGSTDISIGFATAGRRRVEYEPLIGLFANTLVLRGDLSGDPTFRELLRRTRSRLLAAYRHGDVPFDQLLTALDVARDQSRTPLFQAMFGLFNLANPTLTLPGIETEHVEPEFPHATHELRFAVWEKGMLAVYNTDLFDATTITRYVAKYQDILEQVIREPEIPLSRLTAPRGDELDLVVHGWNQAAPGVSGTFDAMFTAQVLAAPDALALVCGPDRLTYAELDRRVTDLAARIPAGRGDLVAIQLPRSTELLVALLAVQRAGAAYVPLDPEYPPARLAFVLDDSGAQPLAPQSEPAAPPLAPQTAQRLATRAVPTAPPLAPRAEATAPKSPPSPEDPAYVLYTSGSTGLPKGVTVPHSALANLLAAMAAHLGSGPGDVWLAATSLSFDISALELYLPLVSGGTVVLAESNDAPGLARLIRAECVTHAQATPSGWRALLDTGFRDPALVALAGGEALPAALARELRPRVGRLVNVYGPTETTIWSTAWEVPADPGEIRIGSPIGGTRCYVVGEHLDPLPIGVPGELLIGGCGVALGYHGRPALTADRFVPDPYGPPGARLYRTGDTVRRRPDGTLEFIGRADNQIKLRGHRIELGEIESVLETVPGVRQAVAAVHGEILVAYVVPPPGDQDELRRRLAERLPEYMIPALFAGLDALPLTANGKVDRRALPAPDGLPGAGRPAYVAPRTDAEELVAEVWSDVLGPGDPIGVHDDFFRIGGHSLMTVRVSVRLAAITGIELPLRTLFARRTVADVATALEERLREELAAMPEEEAERLLGDAP